MTGEPAFRRVVTETLDFVMREMTHPDGGFYSSLDADSEGEEGKFYVWTLDEICSILKDDSEFFEAAYGITARGNWEGKIVLQRALDDSTLAARFIVDPETVSGKLSDSHSKLLAARSSRFRPGTDDKVLTAWNGLMLAAFAEAARALDLNAQTAGPAKYLLVATRNTEFLLSALRPDRQLHRSWHDGSTSGEVFLEDYAALILCLLKMYQTDFNNKWFAHAIELADEMSRKFRDPSGGFFDTPVEGEQLLIRPKDLQDNATPSGNALASEALFKLSAFTDHGEYRDLAKQALMLVGGMSLRYPTAFARWLAVAEIALHNGKQVAILGDVKDDMFGQMLNVLRSEYRPGLVVAASSFPISKDAPALLAARPLIEGNTTAYVCAEFVCRQPTIALENFKIQLAE